MPDVARALLAALGRPWRRVSGGVGAGFAGGVARRGGSRRVSASWASAGGLREPFQPCERGGEVDGPGPAGRESQLRLAAREGEPGGDVQEAVAQPLGLCLGELAREQQGLRPGDQVVGDQDELESQLVHLEVAEGEDRKARVLS